MREDKKLAYSKKFIRQGFDEIALKYDLFNNLITFGRHRAFKKELAKKTMQKILKNKDAGKNDAGKNKNAGKILDICCGTGDITHQLENFAPQNCEIIGMDFSVEKKFKKRKKNSNVLPLPVLLQI